MSLVNLFWAFVFGAGAAASLSYCFNISRYDIIWGAVTGGVGWLVYKLVGADTTVAYFFGAVAISFLSEIFAIVIKNPVTVYLVPGLLPLVPGGGMFQMMRAAVQGNLDDAVSIGFATLSDAGAIALAIALASSVSRLVISIVRHFRKMKPFD